MGLVRGRSEEARRWPGLFRMALMASACSIMPMGEAFGQTDLSRFGIVPPSGVPLPGSPGNPFPGGSARQAAGSGAGAIGSPSGPAGTENPDGEGMAGNGGGGDNAISGLPAGFSMSSFGEVGEIYTTNGSGIRSGANLGTGTSGGTGTGVRTGVDWITRLTLGLQVHDVTPRFQGHLTYTGVGFIFGRNGALDTVRNNAIAIASATLVPERFIVNARAFAAPILVNQLGPISATGTPTVNGTNSGLRNSYGYVLAPTLLFRLGDYVNSNTSVTHQSLFIEYPGKENQGAAVPGVDYPINSVGISASEQLSSGTYFARLNWDLLGSFSKFYRTKADITVKTVMANTQYAINRFFSILATTGYQDFLVESALSRDHAGMTLLGGGQVTLSPAVTASARAGTQLNRFSYVGNLDIAFTPNTSLSGILSDGVRTPGQNLFGGLQSAGVDANGSFYDTESMAQDFGNYTSQYSLTPQGGVGFGSVLSRFRTARLSLQHTDERTEYALSVFRTVRNVLAAIQASDVVRYATKGAQASVRHQLRPDLSADLTGTYSKLEITSGKFDVYHALLTFRYDATADLQFFLTTAYLRRLTDASLASQSPLSGNIADVSVVLGVRRNLF